MVRSNQSLILASQVKTLQGYKSMKFGKKLVWNLARNYMDTVSDYYGLASEDLLHNYMWSNIKILLA